jgi:hypothetical protein
VGDLIGIKLRLIGQSSSRLDGVMRLFEQLLGGVGHLWRLPFG